MVSGVPVRREGRERSSSEVGIGIVLEEQLQLLVVAHRQGELSWFEQITGER
jgi:hypothetical protein